MKFRSTRSAMNVVAKEFKAIDMGSVRGADAVELVELATSFKNMVDAFHLDACANAVACNQHNADGARSGAEWVAKKTGLSEKEACSKLATRKALDDLPDIGAAAASGSISSAQAAAIAAAAEGDAFLARQLLNSATNSSVDEINREAQDKRARLEDAGEKRRQLQRSQFISVQKDKDNVVTGQFRFLGEKATHVLEAYNKARGDTAWERAEDFLARLQAGGSNGKPSVVFHVELNHQDGEFSLGERCEVKGVGAVPMASALDVMEQASKSLVGTVNNKLVHFSEETKNSSTARLPDWLKRAVKARAWDRCETKRCPNAAEEVDHGLARTNGGTNDPDGLRATCEQCHHAKTKQDAPWTGAGIYAKKQAERKQKRERQRRRVDEDVGDLGAGEMFPDTG